MRRCRRLFVGKCKARRSVPFVGLLWLRRERVYGVMDRGPPRTDTPGRFLATVTRRTMSRVEPLETAMNGCGEPLVRGQRVRRSRTPNRQRCSRECWVRSWNGPRNYTSKHLLNNDRLFVFSFDPDSSGRAGVGHCQAHGERRMAGMTRALVLAGLARWEPALRSLRRGVRKIGVSDG